MNKIILLLCSILLTTTISAQILQNGVPVILNNGGDFGEQIFSTDPESTPLRTNFTIISRDATQLYSSSVVADDGSSDFELSPTSPLPASSDFSVRYLDAGFGFGYFPTFHKTASVGTAPNRDITLEGLFFGGSTEYLETYVTPEDDFGLKTIGARSPIPVPGTFSVIDGAFTVAAREGADGLYQLVAIRTGFDGDIRWETVIPTEQTGYDIIFQGQVDGEFVYETQPIPPVSIIKEVPDGYIIVNQNKLYSPPTANEQYANIIKLDFAGNVLWNNNFQIPWREIEIGSNSSLDLGLRGRVTSVEGIADGSTYFTFSSSGDINPNAQFRKLDNTGEIIQSFSTSWMLNDNFSWLIKEIDGEVFWVKLSGIFTDDGPPTNAFDFAIFNITNGITNVEAANNPVAFLPPTPGVTFVPKDLEQLANGDFLVTGDYYENVAFPDFGLTNADSQPFVVRLDNNDFINNPDLELSSSVDNSAASAFEYITLTYTVTNTGQGDASFVQVEVNGENTVLSGESTPVLSQGTFGGSGGDGLWVIGDLAAGEEATLEVTYFTLNNSSSYCAEVSSIAEVDPDSSPANGECGNPQEDDETYLEIGQQAGIISGTVFLDQNRDGGENCQSGGCTFIPNIEIRLYIQGTNTLVATAVSQANGAYIFTNVSPGQYNLEYEIQNNYVTTPFFNGNTFQFNNNFLAINNAPSYIGVSVGNGGEQVFNLGLVDGTDCTLEELFAETICDNNGTPNNLNDDTFEVNFRADGQGRGTYSLNNGAGQLTGGFITYSDGFRRLGPFDISELPATLTVNNLGSLPSTPCSLSETITSVDCGTTGGSQPDLTVMATGTIPASIQPGENYPSAVDFTNSGASFTNTLFNSRIYISTDATLDASDIWVSGVGSNGLVAGEAIPFLNIFVPEDIELGEYFILAVTDALNQVEESNENNNILARPVTIGPVGTGDVDLELTASAEVPSIYQNGEAVFTITNTGTQTATNIEILFAKNSSLNITGVPAASQGSTDVHWTDAPEWSVGSLAAGQSATITFGVFALSNTPTLYGQVVFQGEVDTDSSPDNGNGTSPNEDDEAVYPGNSTPPVCNITITQMNTPSCNDNGTPTESNDDLMQIQFVATVDNNGGNENIFVRTPILTNGTFVYELIAYSSGELVELNFNIEAVQQLLGGVIPFEVIAQGDNDCTANISFNAPMTCSETGGFSVTCVTNITPPLPVSIDPADDYSGRVVTWNLPTATTDCPSGVTIEQISGLPSGSFFNVWANYIIAYEISDECGNSEICVFELEVSGIIGDLICPDDIIVEATSPAGIAVDLADATPVTSCISGPVGPAPEGPQSGDIFPIGTTTVEYRAFFGGSLVFCQNTEICTMTVTVLPEDDGGADEVDLELTASSDAPTIYQNGFALFTITNNGTETATGVELEFHKNNTLNITGTPTVSQGTSQLHWTDVPRWNVGTLAAGQSATITYDIFSLSDDINFYGQVTAQNEVDADSTPNNGDGTTPVEDDETSYPGGEIVVPCQLTITQIEYACDDQGTSDVSDDTWIQTYVIDNTNPNATGFNISPGGGAGTYPSTLSFGGLVAAAGFNPNMYLITDIDAQCSNTIGVFPPAGCGEEPVDNLPDLTLSNLNILEEAVAGQFMDYNVLVSNIGTVTANGNYIIGAYVSTDNNLSADDAQLGLISSGNTPVGTEPTTPGAINIPLSQTPGNYFLILETDTNGDITESNESNNIISVPFVILENTSTCDLNIELVSIHCDQSMGSGGVVNDEFFYYLMATGGDDLTGWYLDPGPFSNYEFNFSTLFTGNISDGSQTFTARAFNDANCTNQITIVPPAPCNDTGCNLNVFTNDIACSGNNYSMELFVTGSINQGNQYTAIFPSADGSGETFEITGSTTNSTPPIITYVATDVINNLGGLVNYTVFRTGNPDCAIEGQLFMPSTCTPDAGSGIDLSLDISAPAMIGQYQNFTAEYVVTNNGTTTATNVYIDFFATFDNNIVFQGGNEGTVSQGGFEGSVAGVFNSGIWEIGSIPAGGSAILTANLFSLAASSDNFLWAEVSAHNETDSDSTPANGVYPQANEDDEAVFAVTITSNLQGNGTNNSALQINEFSAKLYPVPTRDNLSIDVFTQNTSETQLFIRDTHGKVLMTRTLAEQKGIQTIQIATDNWANGVYFMQLFNGVEMQTYRFVKQ